MSNKFIFKGEFRGTGETKSGTSNGKEWKLVNFLVMDMQNQYAKAPVVFQTFESGVIETVESIKNGRDVEVEFIAEGTEWNGRNFVNLKALMVNVLADSVDVIPPKQKAEPNLVINNDDDNDLPF